MSALKSMEFNRWTHQLNMSTIRKLILIHLIIILQAFRLEAQESYILRGKVTSIENNPLFNVDIWLKNGIYTRWDATTTDSLGTFILPEVYSGDTLIFSGVQFKQSHTEVINGNNYMHIRIPLQITQITGAEIEAQGPRQITSIKPKKRSGREIFEEGSFPNYAVVRAQPDIRGSWGKFNEIVNTQLKYPKDALDNRIEGIVVVGFNISIDGTIEKMKILKGIGYGCDEEVLRILSQKIKWQPALLKGRGVAQEFEYSVIFSLKK